MKLELVESNRSLVVTSPFYSLIKIDVHFPHICICLCFYFSCNGFLNDIFFSNIIDLSD